MNDPVVIGEDPQLPLVDYATIPSRIHVDVVFDIVGDASNALRIRMLRRTLAQPYSKDYDAPPCVHPRDWAGHYDLTDWGFLHATVGMQAVARAAIAWRSPGINLLDDRDDVALLWDIRVAPQYWRRGVGSLLFHAVEQWGRQRGVLELHVETQNVNVGACEFYAQQGCVLCSVNRHAYADLPDEVQLVWRKSIDPHAIA